ncbi:MAG: trypsin-like peptidase domain-containing protein [Pirellulales bacterium]
MLIGGAAWVAYDATTTVRNAYAVEWVAGMMVRHLTEHPGAWPRGWDELRDDYDAAVAENGRPWTFEELQSRVVVDWHTDVRHLAELARSDQPFPRVFRLVDGRNDHWSSTEPDKVLRDYLRSSAIRTEPSNTAQQRNNRFKRLLAAMPAIVQVQGETSAEEAPSSRSAVGVVLDARGYVAVATTELGNSKTPTVVLHDERNIAGRVVNADSQLPLSIVKIEAPPSLPAIAPADEDLQIGDEVFVVHSMYAGQPQLTAGIISGRQAIDGGPERWQIDSAIGPGLGSGPVFDLAGRFVGIVSQGGPQGIGFAVTSQQLREILQQADGK